MGGGWGTSTGVSGLGAGKRGLGLRLVQEHWGVGEGGGGCIIRMEGRGWGQVMHCKTLNVLLLICFAAYD